MDRHLIIQNQLMDIGSVFHATRGDDKTVLYYPGNRVELSGEVANFAWECLWVFWMEQAYREHAQESALGAGQPFPSPTPGTVATMASGEPTGGPAAWELGIGQYTAVLYKDKVVIMAEGTKPGAAYEVALANTQIAVYPPQYVLRWRSTDIGTMPMTSFRVTTEFQAKGPVEAVIIYDRDGRHSVPVKAQYLVISPIDGGVCLMVPDGSIIPMIYTQVFGPASERACRDYIASHCR